MASASREIPTRPDQAHAEHRSGPLLSGSFFSEMQSAIAPVIPKLPPPRRRVSLRLKLRLFILLTALVPGVILAFTHALLQRGSAEEHARRSAALMRNLLVSAPAAGCDALIAQERPRLRAAAREGAAAVALYSGTRPLYATLPSGAPFTPPAVSADLIMRVLESDQAILGRTSLHGEARLSAFTRLEPPPAGTFACERLILLVLLPDRLPGAGVLGRVPPAIQLVLALFLILPIALLLPARLVRELERLHARVLTLSRRSAESSPEDSTKLPALSEALLTRGDELGDLTRAFAKLSDTMRENEARLSARVRELTTLYSIGRDISSILDLEEALRKIVGEVVAVFSARRGALVLVGAEMRYDVGASVRIEERAIPHVATLGEMLIRRGGRVRIDDISQDPEIAKVARQGGLSGSLMAVPLDQQGRILGILLITRSQGRQRFTESDLQLLATVASQASTAISNARLYDEVQRSSEDLELRVKERTLDLLLANEELERTLTNLHNTQAQLVLSERLAGLGQLVAGVAHEINSPAGAIQGAADSLRENVARLAERSRDLAELPLGEPMRRRFLQLCEEVAPRLHGSLLLAPTLLRRRSRDLATGLSDLIEGEDAEVQAELTSACRTLVELGVEAEGAGPERGTDALPERMVEHLADIARSLKGSPVKPVHGLAILVEYLEQRCYLHRNAQAIRTAIGHITRIVGALKSYSHLDQARIGLTDVHEGLETTLVILHSELKYGILLTRKYGTVPCIHAYVDELNQIWTNLLHNAVQALNESPDPEKSKEIVIETGHAKSLPEVPTEALAIEVQDKDPEEGFVWVAIEDNGPGIPKDVLPRIFEPFFTTKQKGEGTGLGLGIVQQIVSKHRGRIDVRSVPGRTRFTVWLPVSGPRAKG